MLARSPRYDVAVYCPLAAGFLRPGEGRTAGAERQMVLLARELGRRGFRVALVVNRIGEGEPLGERALFRGVEKLAAGTWLRLGADGSRTETRWWDPFDAAAPLTGHVEVAAEWSSEGSIARVASTTR